MDRVALIPGGARGLGRAIGLELAARGWSVAIAYRDSADAAEETRVAIEARGGAALAVRADVAEVAACEALVTEVTSWRGRIDALVHAAGPYHRVAILDETPAGWRAMFATNLDSLFFLSRLVARGMVERGWGRIIAFAIANADRLQAQPGLTAYYLAKVGVLGLVRSLAKELAKNQVTVNAISPGFIDAGAMTADERAARSAEIPAGYIGAPTDAAHAALYLMSDEAAYVTGTNLIVSGGWGI
jgi:NAD(P)-dependent dehydrogenase (short-subunit alcohol dehydrogenase family)